MDILGDTICRICCKNQKSMYSLFSVQKGISPYEKLLKIGMKTTVNDRFSSSICNECIAELDITYNFIEKCLKSDQVLSEKLFQVSDLEVKDTGNTEQVINYSENSDLYIHQEPSEICFDDVVKDNNVSSTEEFKCIECGSKRSCSHWSPPTTHTCPYCQKVFNRKFNFKLHIARHKGIREWSCLKCGTRTVSRWLAARHCMPRARASCPVPGCHKTYTTNTNLQTHLRTHNGERPFACTDCDKKFASKNTLNDHMRIHTGELPYICPVCGKQFRTNKLSTHMNIHSNVARHVCSRVGCSLRFTSRRALLKHNRVHHPIASGLVSEPGYSCTRCPARYHHKQSLNKHVKKKHIQKPVLINMLVSNKTLDDNVI